MLQYNSTDNCLYQLIACLHDENKNGFYGGPALNQPIRAI